MTEEIAKYAGKVIAVEIDSKLIPILKENLKDYNNVEIINKDFLKLDLQYIINNNNYNKIKIVANLPYYIATNIIVNILKNKYNIDSLTIMVQKEVADRIKAKPKCKNYGSLSLFVQYYAEAYVAANVPKNSFIPRPQVNSTVIYLKINKKSIYNVNEKLLFKIIRASFAKRRKTLINCISTIENFNLNKEEIINLLVSCGFKENIRGEELSLEDFIKITNEIEKLNN